MTADEHESKSLVCDRCGKPLLVDEDVRYIVDIRVYAAYDPMEISAQDLRRDHAAEMRRIVESLRRRDPKEVEDEVFQQFIFHLCPDCRRRYTRDPLAGSGT